jgi:hypothetical protein
MSKSRLAARKVGSAVYLLGNAALLAFVMHASRLPPEQKALLPMGLVPICLLLLALGFDRFLNPRP